MKIMMAFIHYPISSGRYMSRAFRRLGHDVRTVGPGTGPHVWGMELPEAAAHTPNAAVNGVALPGTVSLSLVLDKMKDWRPDLIVTMDSAFSLRGASDIPHVLYGVDNHVRDYRIPTHSGEWDYKFLAHGFGQRMEDANTRWLPCAYDPLWHKQLIDYSQRPYFGALIGVMYPERVELVKALGEHFLILADIGAVMDMYSQIYNQAVVSICRSVAGDTAQRIFETAAMGNVILSDNCHDFEALGFLPDVHYIPYTTTEEAVDRMRALYEGPEERVAELAYNARQWAAPHTWDARAQTILNTVFPKGGQ